MNDANIIRQRLHDSIQVKQHMIGDPLLMERIARLADCISQALSSGRKLVLCGNGGSASDALHFAGEIIGRFQMERKPWPAVVLNADVATMTAIANDYGYDRVFERQTEGVVRAGDVFIGISTSGNSENVRLAILKAKELGATTACLSGKGGGAIAGIVDYPVVVPSQNTARIQECHITVIHILCELTELALAGKSDA